MQMSTSTLTCLPWDGNKGGVLVLNVQDTVTLNANIDVSGKGFKGGQIINPLNNSFYCHENDYYYPSNPLQAAPKGEGIAFVSSLRSYGKGALANGGGGGLEHNSGGGGGSNGVIGGKGGMEWITCGPPLDNGGLGGISLNYNNTENRIFLGGGGGAGHCNNLPGFNSNGGNGGGIIILSANFLKSNNHSILSDGSGGIECIRDAQAYKCHEGMGGGGGGGTVLIKNSNYLDNLLISVKGGKGADMNGEIQGKLGPGGGGSGGITWLSVSAPIPSITILNSGGVNGVNIDFANDSYGSTPGQNGTTLFDLNLPITNTLFQPNIDSVRFNSFIAGCSTFDFEGLAFTNTAAINSWQWFFGDGNTANTQNASHTYAVIGTYIVKLIVTDINGCKDSISKSVTANNSPDFDFNYKQDVCDPLTVRFTGIGNDNQNPYWSFGDGATITGTTNPLHTYTSEGNYIVRYSVSNGVCTDTISKTINISSIYETIILTNDTTICAGTTKQLLTNSSLNFCWTPTTYLNDPNSPNPITSTPQNITYYFTAEVPGNNIIANGNFSGGNTGFTSAYTYQSSGTQDRTGMGADWRGRPVPGGDARGDERAGSRPGSRPTGAVAGFSGKLDRPVGVEDAECLDDCGRHLRWRSLRSPRKTHGNVFHGLFAVAFTEEDRDKRTDGRALGPLVRKQDVAPFELSGPENRAALNASARCGVRFRGEHGWTAGDTGRDKRLVVLASRLPCGTDLLNATQESIGDIATSEYSALVALRGLAGDGADERRAWR